MIERSEPVRGARIVVTDRDCPQGETADAMWFFDQDPRFPGGVTAKAWWDGKRRPMLLLAHLSHEATEQVFVTAVPSYTLVDPKTGERRGWVHDKVPPDLLHDTDPRRFETVSGFAFDQIAEYVLSFDEVYPQSRYYRGATSDSLRALLSFCKSVRELVETGGQERFPGLERLPLIRLQAENDLARQVARDDLDEFRGNARGGYGG